MTLESVDRALNGIDAQWKAPVYGILSRSASLLYSGASQEQLFAIGLELSQISGGVGLDILSLFLWPNEEGLPETIESMVSNVAANMARYQSESKEG